MKTTCITHPRGEKLLLIRYWQIQFCDKNQCAAALLSYFEYWHNIKLESSTKNSKLNDIATQYGDGRQHDESLLQFHSLDGLASGILNLYSRNSIATALTILVQKGVLSVQNNPNPRYAFDRTRFYQFHPEVCNQWLSEDYAAQTESDPALRHPNPKLDSDGSILTDRSPKRNNRDPKYDHALHKKGSPSPKIGKTITEITPKITSKITSEYSKSSQTSLTSAAQEQDSSEKMMMNQDDISGISDSPPQSLQPDSAFSQALRFLEQSGVSTNRLKTFHERKQLAQIVRELSSDNQAVIPLLQAAVMRASQCQALNNIGVGYLIPIIQQLRQTQSGGFAEDTLTAESRLLPEVMQQLEQQGYYAAAACAGLFA